MQSTLPATSARDREVYAQMRARQLRAPWVWAGAAGFCRSAHVPQDDFTPGLVRLYYAGGGREAPRASESGLTYSFLDCVSLPER
jgi:hypothetical protein